MIVTKKQIAILLVITTIVLGVLWIAWGNSSVTVTRIDVTANVPESFDSFKIGHVSDLHNTQLGRDNKRVIDELKAAKCDIIVITGDLVDSRRTDIDVAVKFVQEAVKLAPVYYVTGNHEARVGEDYALLREGLIDAGAAVLENKTVDIVKENDIITLIGLNDTGFDLSTGIDYQLDLIMPDNDNYKILLAHRPEYFDKYNGVDLVLSGHAHGGQFRLPFIGGIFSPGQGFFPKYDSGLYEEHGKTMIVSRGLGNSLFPFRVNNNPELVIVSLKEGDKE